MESFFVVPGSDSHVIPNKTGWSIYSAVTTLARQGHFGAKDAMAGFSDPPTAKRLEDELQAAGAQAEVGGLARGGRSAVLDTSNR